MEATKLSRFRLGDLLVARKLITQEHLKEALESIQHNGGRLGEVLVQMGYLAESDLVSTLAQQINIPYEQGPDLDLDVEIAKLISEETAQRLSALPIRAEGNMLVVAITDPLNFMALDHIALKTGRPVRSVAITSKTFQRALVKVFGIPEADENDALPTRVFDISASEDSPVIRLVNTIFSQAVQFRASDIHLEPMEDKVRVRYRIDGALMESNPLPRSIHAPLISRLKVMANMDIAERRIPQDGQIMVTQEGRRIDLRVSTVPCSHGERMVIRLLERNQTVKGIEQLNMPPEERKFFDDMITRPNGLILVTGPTGSGKSTTLMTTLSHLNKADVNILTIEDPVEYNIPGVAQVQVNNKAGLTFAAGLRSFLRQDPDIIMIGEIRDMETADIAIRAALTGHLVFSTLHTNDSAGAVGRLVDMGVEPFLLASSLLGVVSQRLIRVLCPRCKKPHEVPEQDPNRYLPGVPRTGPLTLYESVGCGFCDQLGYRGRNAIFELLPITGPVREMIIERRTAGEIQEYALKTGVMRTLWTTGLEKVLNGTTSLEELRRVAFAEG
ncbi:MAG: GspE/PulE family protein [Bacillota bacterium]